MATISYDVDRSRLATAKAWKSAIAAARDAFAAPHLFGDPGWSLIIELYICRKEERCLALDATFEAMGVSEASALRWARFFERSGWLVSISDVDNSHAMYLRITDEGLDRAEIVLDAAVAADRR
jgi:hypothetical protein